MSVTNFAKAIDNIANYVGSPYYTTGGFPKTLTLSAAHGIPSSTFDNSGWVRVTLSHAGTVKTVLKATAAPTTTSLTISGTADSYSDVTEATTSSYVAELRICAGAFTNIHTAVNNLEDGTSTAVKIGNPVVSGTNNGMLFVNSSGNLDDTGPTYNSTNKVINVGTGSGAVNPEFGVNYNISNQGGNFTYRASGTNAFAFGSNCLATYGGTANQISGRYFYIYDYIPYNGYTYGVNRLAVNANGQFYFGDVATNYSFIIETPSIGSSVTGSRIDSNGNVVVKVKTTSGAPSDSPSDGAIVVNTNENRIYVRSGGAWKYASLT